MPFVPNIQAETVLSHTPLFGFEAIRLMVPKLFVVLTKTSEVSDFVTVMFPLISAVPSNEFPHSERAVNSFVADETLQYILFAFTNDMLL